MNFPKDLWVYHQAVDLRKSYLGLCSLLENELSRDSKTGAGYVFVNRTKTLAKVLWWDRTGWSLFLKKLQTGRYRVSGNEQLTTLKIEKRIYFFDGL